MNKKNEQRICIKFCAKNEINAAKTLEMLKKCYGDDALTKVVVNSWHALFRGDDEVVNEDDRSDAPTASAPETHIDIKTEQRICIKLCVKNKINGAKTLAMLKKCYGSDALTKTGVYIWHYRFRSGRQAVDDNNRSGRPSTTTTEKYVDKIKDLLTENPSYTIRELADLANISTGSVHSILTNQLGLRRVSAKMMPKDLSCKTAKKQQSTKEKERKDQSTEEEKDGHKEPEALDDSSSADQKQQREVQSGDDVVKEKFHFKVKPIKSSRSRINC